jgi:hypothetical protein
MNSPLPASGPAQRRNWTRRLVNLLVALVVVAVAAATFVFSYDGVHAIALIGGMSKQLARYYPGLFDAVLVIACVAAVMLRDGRWWARLWAWVVVIVILAAIGTTDVLHAMDYTLRHRVTEGVVAAAPVVAVLLAFSLLLTLLRQSRTQAVEAAGPAPLDLPALPAAVSAPIALPAAPVALAAPATVAAEARPAAEDRPAADVAPTREDPVVAEAPRVPQGEAPRVAAPEPATPESAHAATKPNAVLADASPTPESSSPESPAHPGTEPNEVIAPAAAPEPASPESAAAQAPPPEAAAVRGEFAPPTVQVPAMTTEPEAPPTRGPHGIRYAGSGVPGMAGKQQAAEDDEPPNPEYWDAEGAEQFAGLVYPAREDRADPDDTGDRDDTGDFADDAEASRADGVNETEADEAAPRKVPPELDDDAPPFATAPFASVPRLNRVRSMPAPPADEDE